MVILVDWLLCDIRHLCGSILSVALARQKSVHLLWYSNFSWIIASAFFLPARRISYKSLGGQPDRFSHSSLIISTTSFCLNIHAFSYIYLILDDVNLFRCSPKQEKSLRVQNIVVFFSLFSERRYRLFGRTFFQNGSYATVYRKLVIVSEYYYVLDAFES